MKNRHKFLVLLMCVAFHPLISHAEIVSSKISEKITATANYRFNEEGAKDGQPLLIFIHGFLQTREFSTVKRLADSLFDNGYSVLSPNLSLGISNRNSSLACESIHLHTLADDAKEVNHWVAWAKQQGHNNIVLIGHSAGSVSITYYQHQYHDPAVKKAILISLTYFGPGRPAANETAENAATARQMIDSGKQSIEIFGLNYCKRYATTPEAFMSYYLWGKEEILQTLAKSTIENNLVIGSKDSRIDQGWIESLQQADAKISMIDGANHFFDMTHEFDLVDTIESLLTGE